MTVRARKETWRNEGARRFHNEPFATRMSEFSQISRLQEENRKVMASCKHQRADFFVFFNRFLNFPFQALLERQQRLLTW